MTTEQLLASVYYDHGCWGWRGPFDRDGYARTSHTDGGSALAHRRLFEAHKAPLGDLTVDHLCRNRGCVNPDHMEAVTTQVNTARRPPAELTTRCPAGHEMTPSNTYVWSGRKHKHRVCRTCRREREAARRQKAST